MDHGGIVAGDIVSHGSHTVLEVDQVEQEVAEGRDFWVELALGDQDVGLLVEIVDGIVTEALHEADLVTVRQVVQVLEEGLLLWGVLIVVAVLLDTFSGNVLSPGLGALLGGFSEILRVKQGSSHRTVS